MDSLSHARKLLYVKLLHTLAWVVIGSCIVYVAYSGITGNITQFTWICIGVGIAETVVLLIFKWYCPLTLIAMKYTDDRRDNFDIFLPEILAKYNKWIFGTIFVVGLILVVYHEIFS